MTRPHQRAGLCQDVPVHATFPTPSRDNERDAVPTRGIANPHPGGFGMPNPGNIAAAVSASGPSDDNITFEAAATLAAEAAAAAFDAIF